MADADLSKLKIDKSVEMFRPLKRRRLFRWIVAACVVAVVVALYLKGVFTPPVKVDVIAVSQIYPSQTFTLLNASGYVVAQRKAAVASKVTGRIVSLSVEEGNLVKNGDVIARLENEDAVAIKEQAYANLNVAKANLAQTKAELADATLMLSRNKELVLKGYISRSEYDVSEARLNKATASVAASEAGVKAASAALKNAEVSLEYTLIRAPFDAVVLSKNADIGDIITPLGAAANAKAAVFTIADMNSLQVEVDVSESNLGQVMAGQPCEIELDAVPKVRYRGSVHMVVPTADRTKATVLVKVKFIDSDRRILPEMSARVAFLRREVTKDEQKSRTAIPPAALLARKNGKVVFVVNGEKITETTVISGEQIGDMVEVISGVKAGDKIVLRPGEGLKNGDRIRVAEK